MPLILVLSACGVGAIVTEAPGLASSPLPSKAPIETPVAGEVKAVSATHPTAGAADAMAKCQIGETIPVEKVSRMGEIALARDIVRYVPLTGREPQLGEAGPAWIIQIQGDVPMPLSGEIWTNPTCVVTTNDYGYYGTGPIRNTSTGALSTPEPPAVQPDLTLPALAP